MIACKKQLQNSVAQAAAERARAKQADVIAAEERKNAIVAHSISAVEEEEARVATLRAEEEAKDVKIAQENLQVHQGTLRLRTRLSPCEL